MVDAALVGAPVTSSVLFCRWNAASNRTTTGALESTRNQYGESVSSPTLMPCPPVSSTSSPIVTFVPYPSTLITSWSVGSTYVPPGEFSEYDCQNPASLTVLAGSSASSEL